MFNGRIDVGSFEVQPTPTPTPTLTPTATATRHPLQLLRLQPHTTLQLHQQLLSTATANSYTYFDTETFTDAETGANA